MEEKRENSTKPVIWSDYSISSKLLGNEYYNEFKDKLNELMEIANKMAPEGRFVMSLSTKDEKFRDLEVLASNAIIAKKIFNERSIMSNPANATEFGSLLVKVRDINTFLDKKKRKIRESRKPSATK